MKWLAILNPRSGHHTWDETRQLAIRLHERLGADVVFCAHKKHGLEIVRQHPHYDGYIPVGGDGTIADIVNGMDLDRHSLGIVPAGTGNGLARDLKVSDETAAIYALKAERFENIDVIHVRFRRQEAWHERVMISTSGIGYLAGATELAELPLKRLGAWFYAVAAIAQSLRQQPFEVHCRADDGAWEKRTVTTLIVHNNQYVGQFRIFPEALLTDGLLNVLYGRLAPREQLFEDLGTLTQTYLFRRTTHLAPRKIEVALPVPGYFMVDGDVYVDVDRVCYEVMPRRLRCCVGASVKPSPLEGPARRAGMLSSSPPYEGGAGVGFDDISPTTTPPGPPFVRGEKCWTSDTRRTRKTRPKSAHKPRAAPQAAAVARENLRPGKGYRRRPPRLGCPRSSWISQS